MGKLAPGFVQTTVRLAPELMREFKIALAANGDSAQDIFKAAAKAYVMAYKEQRND